MSQVDKIKNKMKRNAHQKLMQKDETQSNVNINENANNGENNEEISHGVVMTPEMKAAMSGEEEPKKFDKELVGIYFNPEVKAALDRFQKANGRGAKSELINELAKIAMQQRGYL